MDKICKSIRLKTLDVLYKSQASHLGTSMSCVEILVAIYSLLDCDKMIASNIQQVPWAMECQLQ